MHHDMLRTTWGMLDRLGDREPEAWRWFLERYRGFVESGLRRVLPRTVDMDEACHEFFSECFVRDFASRADRQRRFRAYLAGAIRNFGLAWRRRHHQHTPDPNEGGDNLVDSAIQAPVLLPEDEELRLFGAQVLRLALRTLPAKDAMMLSLFYGLDDEVPVGVLALASRMSMNVNAIHQRLHRARHRLRAEVEQEIRRTADGENAPYEIAALLSAIQAQRPGVVG